jgi:uncharacterized membrane protein YgdD (TMEM256/DUF423 family)
MPGFQADIMGSGAPAQLAAAINGTGQMSQTALGTNQATAFALTASQTEFTTVASGTGAILPAVGGRVNAGDLLAVYNKGANALLVYPPVGGAIMLSAANAGVSVPSGKSALFGARGDGNYFSLISA